MIYIARRLVCNETLAVHMIHCVGVLTLIRNVFVYRVLQS